MDLRLFVARLFVAIDLPKEAKDTLIDVQKAFKKAHCIEASYLAPEQMHLTLKFLGSIAHEHLPEIKQALSTVRHDKLSLQINSVGVFPDRLHPHVLWCGQSGDDVAALAQKIDQALEPFVAREERPFAAHLTIARIRRVIDKTGFDKLLIHHGNEVRSSSFLATEFILFQSRLEPNGAIHEPVERYPLFGETGD